ncbi:hypothetical protein PROFUN_10217 [Planoprotostelium fungivorum]|uniref:Uncharacterized protein n=1 Tax=Planoprotostelium fungivorum TaxID=1890364 RepID=A0A2P6MQ74_9EUKA|nr:hypothetical protein PROFUN_10217 [Planoprotostelium fungivorum]
MVSERLDQFMTEPHTADEVDTEPLKCMASSEGCWFKGKGGRKAVGTSN